MKKEQEEKIIEMMQLFEQLEVMLASGESINPDSVIRSAIQLTIMKKEQIKEVDAKIKSIADDITKSTSKVGDTNETYNKRKKQTEEMLFNLCEMYKIAHS